ncbi:hypothetical protein KKD52_00240 [Myxococcota bacterium]|nr:hypothetical protein [Myxococcota bacterium]MBU1412888.1 hypothetical protein [Myxococcota bacterium]MBU1508759.1 hypothetical protein [Myxococcota bacterium]
MAQKNVVVTALPWVVTLFTAAVLLIVTVSFDGARFGQVWPAIPMALFFSFAIQAFLTDATSWMPGAGFLGSFFLFWLLSRMDVMPFGKSWPFLLLIAGLLVVVGILLSKNAKEKKE